MLTVGVDLAAEAERTAIAWIDWGPAGAVIQQVTVGADDRQIIEAITQAEKAGIDCPLGWPEKFIAFISAHQHGAVPSPDDVAGRLWRRKLAFRLTDEVVRDKVGLVPLSVAADRIGHTAMRCAHILAELDRAGQRVDRTGDEVVVEVYPAASLHQWKIKPSGYKGKTNEVARGKVVDDLTAQSRAWLAWGSNDVLCRADDNALDAVVAGITARAASLHLVRTPTDEQRAVAVTEGWIAVPTSTLAELWDAHAASASGACPLCVSCPAPVDQS